MVAAESAKVNGAQLLKRLAETGTSALKLQPAAQTLAFVHRKEGRIATAAEVIGVLERCGLMEPWHEWPQTPDLTLRKARAIAATGQWDGVVEAEEVPVWDKLLAGEPLPEEEEESATDADPTKAVDEDAPHKRNPLLATLAEAKEEPAVALAPVKRKPGRPKSAPATA